MRHAKIKTKRKTIKSYETRLAYVEEIIKARNAQKGKKAQPMSRVWKDCENRKNKYRASLDTIEGYSITIFEKYK